LGAENFFFVSFCRITQSNISASGGECSHTRRTSRGIAATKPPIAIFHGDFPMRVLSVIAVAAAMIANSSAAFAGELPSYEVTSFPISATQVQVLGGAGVEEQSAAPAMIVAGMPASPAQVSVLSPRVKRLASAVTASERR